LHDIISTADGLVLTNQSIFIDYPG